MERKFTDQQMALILKRAADRQAGDGDASHSLESIQEIAREVGIDPGVVAEVAATLDVSRAETALFGASSAYRSSRRIVSHASTIDHAAILAAIREPCRSPARSATSGTASSGTPVRRTTKRSSSWAGSCGGVGAFWASFARARAMWNRHARNREQRMRGLGDALAAQLASGESDE